MQGGIGCGAGMSARPDGVMVELINRASLRLIVDDGDFAALALVGHVVGLAGLVQREPVRDGLLRVQVPARQALDQFLHVRQGWSPTSRTA